MVSEMLVPVSSPKIVDGSALDSCDKEYTFLLVRVVRPQKVLSLDDFEYLLNGWWGSPMPTTLELLLDCEGFNMADKSPLKRGSHP